jgi:hypothetical protein
MHELMTGVSESVTAAVQDAATDRAAVANYQTLLEQFHDSRPPAHSLGAALAKARNLLTFPPPQRRTFWGGVRGYTLKRLGPCLAHCIDIVACCGPLRNAYQTVVFPDRQSNASPLNVRPCFLAPTSMSDSE